MNIQNLVFLSLIADLDELVFAREDEDAAGLDELADEGYVFGGYGGPTVHAVVPAAPHTVRRAQTQTVALKQPTSFSFFIATTTTHCLL